MKLSDIDLFNIKELSRGYKEQVAANAELLKAHIKAIENEVLAEMRAGSSDYSRSLKLVRSKPRRKLTSDALDKDMSPLLEYLPAESLSKDVPITLTELEKLLKSTLELEEAKRVLSEVVTKPEGALVAVPLSDKRPLVVLEDEETSEARLEAIASEIEANIKADK